MVSRFSTNSGEGFDPAKASEEALGAAERCRWGCAVGLIRVGEVTQVRSWVEIIISPVTFPWHGLGSGEWS